MIIFVICCRDIRELRYNNPYFATVRQYTIKINEFQIYKHELNTEQEHI